MINFKVRGVTHGKKIIIGLMLVAVIILLIIYMLISSLCNKDNDIVLTSDVEIRNKVTDMNTTKGTNKEINLENNEVIVKESNFAWNFEDMHSFQIDNWEFKVLAYLDEQNMLVKFPLGTEYIVQVIVPRSLGDGLYQCKLNSSKTEESSIATVDIEKTDTGERIIFAYSEGMEYLHLLEEWRAAIEADPEVIKESMVAINQKEVVVYKQDKELIAIWMDGESQKVQYIMANGIDASMQEIVENLKQTVFRELREDDFVFRTEQMVDNYESRMDAMYQKYQEILEDTDTYLLENYNAPGNEYTQHYLYDLTGDNIPEIIFVGNPRSVMIVGESNAISLPGVSNMMWGKSPNVVFTEGGYMGDVSVNKQIILMDNQGNLVVEYERYLEKNADGRCLFLGEEISQEQYAEILENTQKEQTFTPYLFEEGGTTLHWFNKSVKCLNNEFIFSPFGYVD